MIRPVSLRGRVATLAEDHPRGHVIGLHRHRRDQLIYARAGVMRIETAAGIWIVPPQRAVWVPGGARHAIRCSTSVSLRALWLPPGAWPRAPSGCAVVGVSALLRELILELVEQRPLRRRRALVVELLRSELTTFPRPTMHLPEPRDRRLRRVTDALAASPGDQRSLAGWAGCAGASQRTLTRLFLSETGMTFRQWRRQLRMLTALERLALAQPVTTVALDLGYDSPSAFIDAFRRSFGVTPRRYFAAP